MSGNHEDIAKELARWRSVGRELWPFVRFFGLFGGDQKAIAAAAELGRLLGHDTPNSQREKAAEVARQETILGMAAWFEDSPFIKRMTIDQRKPCLEAMRKLAQTK